MRLALITDTWKPHINSLVTTIACTKQQLELMGHDVALLTPEAFRTIPLPGYRETQIPLSPDRRLSRILDSLRPDALHIATSGPLGQAARSWCLRGGFPFTTSYHRRISELGVSRSHVASKLGSAFVRNFHAAAHATLVRSRSQKKHLTERGFKNLRIWPGAVDIELFRPRGKSSLSLPRPISMYMGHVSRSKGVESFLALELPGSQVVIGDGPDLESFRAAFPGAHFLGPRSGSELANLLSAADVFVYPSRTASFGLVMLEAMACGVPVAALPSPGSRHVIIEGGTGIIDEDLKSAIYRALALDGEACIEHARDHSWFHSARQFMNAQVRFRNLAGSPVGATAGLLTAGPDSPPVRAGSSSVTRL